MVGRENESKTIASMTGKTRDFESEYYGLLHFLKELAPVLKRVSDSSMHKDEIDRHISFIDHEVAKGA